MAAQCSMCSAITYIYTTQRKWTKYTHTYTYFSMCRRSFVSSLSTLSKTVRCCCVRSSKGKTYIQQNEYYVLISTTPLPFSFSIRAFRCVRMCSYDSVAYIHTHTYASQWCLTISSRKAIFINIRQSQIAFDDDIHFNISAHAIQWENICVCVCVMCVAFVCMCALHI